MQPDLSRSRSRVLKVALGAFLVMTAVNLPSTLSYLQLRQEIDRRYQSIEWARVAVVDHALAGKLPAIELVNMMSRDQVSISTSGVITLAFSDLPTGTGDTLKLLPLVISEGVPYPLEKFLKSGRALDRTMIYWACTSNLARSRDEYVLRNQGTLDAEFAPATCR